MFCGRCGEEFDSIARFCPRCGQDMATDLSAHFDTLSGQPVTPIEDKKNVSSMTERAHTLRRKMIEQITAKMKPLEAALTTLHKECKSAGHNVVETLWGSAQCDVCQARLGWYCPDTPNHQCAYTRHYDQCDYCGQPRERK